MCRYQNCEVVWIVCPRLQESQILQNSSEILPTLHFLHESYKFVQDSGNISTKIAFFRKKTFLQKMRCVILTANSLKTVTFVQIVSFSNNIALKGLNERGSVSQNGLP